MSDPHQIRRGRFGFYDDQRSDLLVCLGGLGEAVSTGVARSEVATTSERKDGIPFFVLLRIEESRHDELDRSRRRAQDRFLLFCVDRHHEGP